MKEEKKRGETGTYKRSHVKNNTTHLPEKKKERSGWQELSMWLKVRIKKKPQCTLLNPPQKKKESRFCGLNSVFTI